MKTSSIYERIRQILEQARSDVIRSVNINIVRAYWLVGREIVVEEQRGQRRADYGEKLIDSLSEHLQREFGKGFTSSNLRYMRLFYLAYPHLLEEQKHHAMRDESHQLGQLNPNLSWTHYRFLTKIERLSARSFYEIETAKNHWSSRELERQINSLLFERLAKSKNKSGLMKLALKGQEIETPSDAIKDPFVLEFLDIPESPKLAESHLEKLLINNLQTFLLELGKGFAFIQRQKRLTLEGDHFYVDLVFYHTILKCYVLIDLKVGKLTHADLGQMQLYVNFYDAEYTAKDHHPTVGLILCTDKNDAVVKYTLAKGPHQIFASRYKLYLPTEKELVKEIKKELKNLTLVQNHQENFGKM